MPASETPDAGAEGPPDGKSLSEGSGAATDSAKAAYDRGANADQGGGKAALGQKRKDEMPKSVLE